MKQQAGAEVVGRAEGPAGARWAGAARHIGHFRSCPASGDTSADCSASG